MTACVNKHTKRVAAVVTASLVGALSLGAAAPVAAFAEDISLQANDSAAINGAEVEYKGGNPETEYTYTGRPQGPVPTKVTPTNQDTERVSLNPGYTNAEVGDFYYWYVKIDGSSDMDGYGVQYRNEKGQLVDLKGSFVMNGAKEFIKPTDQGTYAVVVAQYAGNGGWTCVSVADTFKIVGQALDSAVLVEGEDATDTEFNYTGQSGYNQVGNLVSDTIRVAIDGVELDADDYKLEVWESGAKKKLGDDALLDMGKTYIVKVIGCKAYEGQTVERSFAINKMKLSDAVVLGNVSTVQPAADMAVSDAIKSINGISTLDWDGLNDGGALQLTFVSDPDGSHTSNGKKGTYTYTLTAPSSNKNVEGSATVEVVYADYEAAINFGNSALDKNKDGVYEVDLSADKVNSFDLDDISATFTYGSGTSKDVDDDSIAISVVDAEGNEVTDLSKPGTYYVRANVAWNYTNTSGNELFIAGSDVAKVVVAYTVTQANDVFLSYDGQNVVAAKKVNYDGTDQIPHFSVVVKAGNKTLVEGTDYEVVYQQAQDDGKIVDVDSIVDAGYYNVVVRGITFNGDCTFDFEVAPITVDKIRFVSPYNWSETDKDGKEVFYHNVLAHTGDVLSPSYQYYFAGSWYDLPAEAFEVEYVRDVDNDGTAETVELKDTAKDYIAYLSTADGAVNYDVDASVKIEVSDANVFTDVPTSHWAAEYVYTANDLGYMNGYNGTTFFGAGDSIKRGDVAVVLWKMAGMPDYWEDYTTGDTGFVTGFADVDATPGMYYNEAIAWAKAVGIVSGDTGTGNFRPEDTISRQELAAMLARYAEKTGVDTDVDADAVLSAFDDEGTVAEWARDYVAWAVDDGIMGQGSGLRGSDPITRAEVATMAVRLQPNGKLDGSDLLPR